MAPDPALQPLSDDQMTWSAIARHLRNRADRRRAAASAEALPTAALRFAGDVRATVLKTISGGLTASRVWRILARRKSKNLPLGQQANSREAALKEENQSWMAGIDRKDASAEGRLALSAVCANGTED